MAKNLNDSVQGAEQFNEKEPRGAAFKSLFGVLQTTTFNQLSNEGFSKGFTTYPEEIIVEAATVVVNLIVELNFGILLMGRVGQQLVVYHITELLV